MRSKTNLGIKCNSSKKKELIELEREVAESRDLHEKSCKYQPPSEARFHLREVMGEKKRQEIAPKMSAIDSLTSEKGDTDDRRRYERYQHNHDHIRLKLENCSTIISKVNRDYRCESKFDDLQLMNEVNCANIITRGEANDNNENSNKFVHLKTNHLSLMLPSPDIGRRRCFGRHNLLSLNYPSDESINNLESPLEANSEHLKLMMGFERDTTNMKTITNIKTKKKKTKSEMKSTTTSTRATIIEKSKKIRRRRRIEAERREMLMLNDYERNLSSKFKDRIIMKQFNNNLKESSLITVVIMFIIFTLTRVTVMANTMTSYSHQHQLQQQAAMVAPLVVGPSAVAAATKTAHKTAAIVEETDQQPVSLRRATNDEDQNQWVFAGSDTQQIIGGQQPMRQSSSGVAASPLDHVSSADLPAEFRDTSSEADDSAPNLDGTNQQLVADSNGPMKEQSKLAKLCEQTSSVLASVLPAPFGGHKRSILCQFFGSVPLRTNSNQQKKTLNSSNFRQNNQLKPIVINQQQQQPPYDNMESISVLHQAQQRPLTIHSNGKHPIQIVLEQQQRQMAASSSFGAGTINQSPLQQVKMIPQEDPLKSSASIVDYAYHQKLEPPASMQKETAAKVGSVGRGSQMKFSTPITPLSSLVSFKPIQFNSPQVISTPKPQQMLISTSGWRIFNQPPQEVTSQQSVTTQSSKLNNGFNYSTPSPNQNNNSSSNNKPLEERVKSSSSPSSSKSDQKDIKARQASTMIQTPTTPSPLSSQQHNNTSTSASSSMISKIKNKQQQETLNFGSAQLLVMGRPPGFDGNSLAANKSTYQNKATVSPANSSTVETGTNQKQTPNIGKRSEALKSTTRAMDISSSGGGSGSGNTSSSKSSTNLNSSPAQDVRIIEVVAQQSNEQQQNLADKSSSSSYLTSASSSSTSTTQKPPQPTDLHQVQRREELVIASINNLTRIAFGNQLRDTVKVINKLIDQQADLFGKNSPSRVEPLITSESNKQQQIVTTGNKFGSSGNNYDNKLAGKQAYMTKASQTNASGGGGGEKNQNSSHDKLQQQKQSHRPSPTKPTKKPKKQSSQTVSQQTVVAKSAAAAAATSITTKNKSLQAASLPSDETKELIIPKAASFASQKLTTVSIPTTSRGLLRTTQSRSSRNIDRNINSSPAKVAIENRRQELPASNNSIVTNRSNSSTAKSTTPAKPSKYSSTTAISDLDSIVPTVTISDIHRDKSPWKFSPSPYIRDSSLVNSSKNKLAPISSSPNARSKAAISNELKSATNNVATTFPWMLPETNASYESNLFGTTMSSMRKSTTSDAIKRWTSSRKYPTSPSSLTKQPLVLNRLESKSSFEPKLDSLTTLKMSLTTQASPTGQSSGASSTASSQASTTQSRWIPTSSLVARSSQPTSSSGNSITMPVSTSTSTTSADSSSPSTGKTATTTITITTPMPTTKADSSLMTTTRKQHQALSEPINQNDLNEARASDSISKYTTHWNEANEILSTTRRFFQQPLPQIAQTGEFFNSETISTWPERYQTMLNSNSETKTTPSFETTRRNGETYETKSFPSTIARHKLDATTLSNGADEQLNTRTTRPAFMILNSNNMSNSITILPSNHKLTTTTTFSEEQNSATTKQQANNLASKENQEIATSSNNNSDEFKDRTPLFESYTSQDTTINENNLMSTTESSLNKQTLPPSSRFGGSQQPSVAYTMVGPYTNFKPELKREEVAAELGERIKFPRVMNDYLLPSGDSSLEKGEIISASVNSNNNSNNNNNNNNSSSVSSFLKPPYSESHQEGMRGNETSSLGNIDKHNVSRKLYELLVPSTKTFVGPQNPLNLQRFNLSALKFLAQNILMPNKSQRDTLSTGGNSTNGLEAEQQFEGQQYSSNYNNKSQEELLELLNPTLPMSYYDLLSNESMIQQQTQQQSNKTGNISNGKSIFGRAGNLFNDFKQLESKRAAALLAAIRYQVPSPLVRPWDTNSDSHQAGGHSLNSNERLDGLIGDNIADGKESGELESESFRDSLLLAQLSNSIKNALFKQRMIPKNELEARLKSNINNISNHNYNPVIINEEQDILLDRRSDSSPKTPKIVSYSFDENDENFDNSQESKSNISEFLYDKFPLKNGRNFTKNLLNTLLNSTSPLKIIQSPFILRNNNNKTTINNNDFVDQIDFSAVRLQKQQNEPPMKSGSDNQSQYPKYIRLTDNKAAWSLNPEGSLKATSRQPYLPSSAVAAKLRDSSSRNKEPLAAQINNNDDNDEDGNVKMKFKESENKLAEPTKSYEFDCDGKQAGFYPDTETACQTFYHCSNTGHLLTFNCPQQTRFDEKSLKCGPWFEVPCDLGRMKSMRRQF